MISGDETRHDKAVKKQSGDASVNVVTNNRQITHGEEQLVLVSTNTNETFGFLVGL